MTNLKCSVITCINNHNQLCSRPDIKVEGYDAQRKDQTCCYSFDHRSDRLTNSIEGNPAGSPQTEVRCEARECVYNRDTICSAGSIYVTGSDARDCDQTYCDTFKRR